MSGKDAGETAWDGEDMKKSRMVLGICVMTAVFLSGCGRKKDELPQELQNELNMQQVQNATETVEIEDAVVGSDYEQDGVLYHSDTSRYLKVTYPVSSKQVLSKEKVMSVNATKIGKVQQGSTDVRSRRIFYQTLGFPDIYADEAVTQVEYTLMNCSGYLSTEDAKVYIGKTQLNTFESQSVTMTPNQTQLTIVIIKDVNKDTQGSQSQCDEAVCQELNKAQLRARIIYADGTQKEEYLGIQTYNENNYSYYDVYRLEVQ